MDTQKQQIVDRLKQANNILVTVKSNPSVDHLAACIALTLALNKLGKHATAVFSGDIPSTIEFLQPEKTLEKNTDSLRDFIIALDKSKADKLRYKVEDKVVKIFITPYKTSINDKDLEFSQGDFNVDVVLALGVHQQNDLDQAITSHGRILHDATVVSINVEAGPNLGSINWTKPNASSLSELVVEIMDGIDKTLLDGQIATAALTGIVAETDRFSNNRTSPQTMSVSAELMAVGANQQLVATKLSEPVAPPPAPVIAERPGEPNPISDAPKRPDDGTLEIEHDEPKEEPPQIKIDENGSLHNIGGDNKPNESDEKPREKVIEPPEESPQEEPKKSDAAEAGLPELPEIPKLTHEHTEAPHMILQPPTLGGQLSANTSSEFFDPMAEDDDEERPSGQPILNREPLLGSQEKPSKEEPKKAEDAKDTTSSEEEKVITPPAPIVSPVELPTPVADSGPILPEPVSSTSAQPAPTDASATTSAPDEALDETLSDIERQLHSPHVTESEVASTPVADTAEPTPDVSDARDAVAQAMDTIDSTQSQPPIQALNAQPLDLSALQDPSTTAPAAPASGPVVSPAIIPNAAPFAPEGLTLPGVTGATESPTNTSVPSPVTEVQDPNAPPPVPPPMLPPMPS